MTPLVIGLGNVGSRYAKTRHNIGFMIVDTLADRHGGTWKADAKLKARVCSVIINGQAVVLAKPDTMMNLSGQAAQRLMQAYKIPLSSVWAVYDDVDTEFGRVRLRKGGSGGGHQGVNSLVAEVGSDFIRVKVGISLNDRTVEPSEVYVLKSFNEAEVKALPQIITACAEQLETWLTNETIEPTQVTLT